MTRLTPFLAASAIVALLTLGAGVASASTSPGNGGHSPGAPGSPGSSGSAAAGTPQRNYSCSTRADQMGLATAAWQAFVTRCQTSGGF
jgi:hypothetical protein